MKKLFFMIAVCLSIMTGCNKEEMINVMEERNGVITATMEQSSPITRLAIADDNTLSWESSDAFTVFAGSNEYHYKYVSGSDFAVVTGGTPVPDGVSVTGAAYPYVEGTLVPHLAEGVLSMTLPDSYSDCEGGKCALPMWGAWTDGNVSFKHLAGVLRVNLNNLPQGCNSMTIVASNPIAGSFTANVNDATPVLVATEDATNSVTLNFTATTSEAKAKTLYLPLPASTYEAIQVSVSDGTNVYILANWSNKTVARATIYTANATYTEVTSIDDLNTALAAISDENRNAHIVVTGEISGEQTITGPGLEGTSITLDFKNVADGAGLIIDAPKSTVELGSGTFASVAATTAENTLIIGEDVKIETLTITKGNVLVYSGAISNIVNNSSETITITLGGNVTLKNKICFESDINLDLGGYTLTENLGLDSPEYAIYFKGNVNISNGEIETNSRYPIVIDNEDRIEGFSIKNVEIYGDRLTGNYNGAVILVGNANVELEKVIIGAAYYGSVIESSTYDVAGAKSAVVTIKNSNLTLANDQSNSSAVLGAGYGSTINFDGGIIDGSVASYAVVAYPTGGTVNIASGEIKGKFYTYEASETSVPTVINVTKCTFYDASVFNYLASGAEITLGADIIFTEGANGTTHGISYTGGNSFTLDLNKYRVTSDIGGDALRFKIGDGNDITNTQVTITVKNGTVVSGENNWCAISAATAENSGNTLIMNLQDVEVENYKPGDYAVKSCDGATINATNVNVASSYGGSFYAVGGILVLENCTAAQQGLHTAPYMSMAVAVSTKGKAIVHSGIYSTVPFAAEDDNNQGSSHGSWAAGVMNSGGELIINGGTFENGNYGDDELATAARGLIFADTDGVVQVNDGTFNALKSIFDFQNNLGATSPTITVKGGTYSADPRVVTSYGSVVIPDGYTVSESEGTYTVGATESN